MSFGSQYRRYGKTCCGAVQAPPSPCCEPNNVEKVPGWCAYTICDTTAAADGFYLTFKADCEAQVPSNYQEVYFYHAAVGDMRIISKKNGSYFVQPVDADRAGFNISPADCIALHIVTSSNISPPYSFRCLTGLFTAPALNEQSQIYIVNGSSIPIGSTITFTAEGETGTYEVSSYESAAGNIYVYNVENTGGGHTPGTIIDGGSADVCLIPIEVITEVDLCNLTETNAADSITACVGGSPRSFVPTGENDVIVGTSGGEWELRKLTNLDCCVILDGCLKFSGEVCPTQSDAVILKNINIDCFDAAFDAAAAAGQPLVGNIDGDQVIVTAWNSGTRQITVKPIGSCGSLALTEYPEGSSLCLGQCCDQCTNGPRVTTPLIVPVPDTGDSVADSFAISGTAINHDSGVTYWLVGRNMDGDANIVQELDSAYFADPSTGPLPFPKMTDALVLKQKFCNDSEFSCTQVVDTFYNYSVNFLSLDADVTVDWEVAGYIDTSETLCGDVIPNPFSQAGNGVKAAGTVVGPTTDDTTLDNTPFGPEFGGTVKPFPYAAGTLHLPARLDKCNCLLSIVWFFLRVTASGSGSFTPALTIGRFQRRDNVYTIPQPENTPGMTQGWN